MRKKSTSKITTLRKNWQCRSLSIPEKLSVSMLILKHDDDIDTKAHAVVLLCSALIYRKDAQLVKLFVEENEQNLPPIFVERLQKTAQRVLTVRC